MVTKKILPVDSQLSSSPDILLDDVDRIVIAYAVPVNEGRGIYLIQSTDFGETWSQPVRVFDAVSANVQMVDRPKIGLSGDGRLHMLFIGYSLQEGGRPVGLYYSESVDGGATWSTSELISELDVRWSDIVYSDGVLYRFWQEQDGAILNDFYQISQDEGLTWTSPSNVVVQGDQKTEPIVSIDPNRRVHYVYLLKENDTNLEGENTLTLQDWMWDGQQWRVQGNDRSIKVKGNDFNLFTASGITSQGFLNLSFAIVHPAHEAELNNSIMSIGRIIEVTDNNQASPPLVIPVPDIPMRSQDVVQATEIPKTTETQIIATEPSQQPPRPVFDTSPSRRNLVGYILVGFVALVILVFAISGRKKRSK